MELFATTYDKDANVTVQSEKTAEDTAVNKCEHYTGFQKSSPFWFSL